MRTRSPGLNTVTAGPTLSTMPTPSWPRMRPGWHVGTSPLRMCRSVPQIVVFTILTIASVGAVISGFGRSSRAFLPGPRYTKAFIVAALVSRARVAGLGIVVRVMVWHLSCELVDGPDHVHRAFMASPWSEFHHSERKT